MQLKQRPFFDRFAYRGVQQTEQISVVAVPQERNRPTEIRADWRDRGRWREREWKTEPVASGINVTVFAVDDVL